MKISAISVGDHATVTATVTVVSSRCPLKETARFQLEVSESKNVIFFTPSKFTDLLAAVSLIVLPCRKQPEAVQGEGAAGLGWGPGSVRSSLGGPAALPSSLRLWPPPLWSKGCRASALLTAPGCGLVPRSSMASSGAVFDPSTRL